MIPAAFPFAAAALLLAAATPEQGRSRLEELQAEQAAREAREAELTREAETAAGEAQALQQDLVVIGDDIARLEQQATEAETRLTGLTAEEEEAAAALAADRQTLVRTMAALQRAELRKPPPLAVRPDDAADAARAALLLGAIAPALEDRAQAVRTRIEEITSLRADIATEQENLRRSQAEMDGQRLALNDRIAERAALEETLRAGAQEEAEAARRIAGEARDLADLIARLEAEAEARRIAEAEARERAAREAREQAEREEAERQRRLAAGEAVPPAQIRPPGSFATPAPAAPRDPADERLFAEARGTLRAPAEGPIVAAFGAPRDAGSDDGILIATRPSAQVVSPFDATVEFSDEFGNYGRMLILSVGDGYHIVLAGLGRLYAVKGQSVLAGEPLGEMANTTDPAPELYYQISRNGAPIDPAPWIRGERAG